MNNLSYYFWLAILIIYIIIPFDAHPLFFDDLIAAAVLFYLWHRNANRKNVRHRASTGGHSREDAGNNRAGSDLSLKEAYDLLGVKPGASMEEVKKAYMEKISRSHPDKVHHLSDELIEKAKEITLKLNNAHDIIKQEIK